MKRANKSQDVYKEQLNMKLLYRQKGNRSLQELRQEY